MNVATGADAPFGCMACVSSRRSQMSENTVNSTAVESAKSREQTIWNDGADAFVDGPARVTVQAATPVLAALALRPGEALLDLCCGGGALAGAAEAMGAKVTGVDYASRMVSKASARFPRVAFKIGDAEALDVREREFDAVACNMALMHLNDPAQALSEAHRALRVGGRIVWSHWAATREPSLWRAVADTVGADPNGRSLFPLVTADAAAALMRKAGFRDVEVIERKIAAPVPSVGALAFAAAFSARLAAVLAAAPAESALAWEAELDRRAAGDGRDRIEDDAPVLIVSGRRGDPSEPARTGRFGIVRKLLGAGDDAR